MFMRNLLNPVPDAENTVLKSVAFSESVFQCAVYLATSSKQLRFRPVNNLLTLNDTTPSKAY